jgi:MOSC domain-containing protein YiiM
MKLVSIQVGQPDTFQYRGHVITTSIFKKQIAGPVMVRELNIDGDKQADLKVHGGRDKAVYAYSLDAYTEWNKLSDKKLENGALGENLSFDSFDEKKMGLGDIYQLGQCKLQIVQPRVPCFKLAIRLDDAHAIKNFNNIQRPGVYFRVLEEGVIDNGMSLELLERENVFVSVYDLFQVTIESVEREKLEAILKIKSLNTSWRTRIEKTLTGY